MLSGGPGGAWRPARPAWSYSESVLLDFLTAKAPLLGDFDPAPVDVNVHPRCRSSLRTKSPLRSKMNASRPIFLRSSGARFNRVPLRGPRRMPIESQRLGAARFPTVCRPIHDGYF